MVNHRDEMRDPRLMLMAREMPLMVSGLLPGDVFHECIATLKAETAFIPGSISFPGSFGKLVTVQLCEGPGQ